MTTYFTDEINGARPRIVDEIDLKAWHGLRALIDTRIGDASFGCRFPLPCSDEGKGPYACDSRAFRDTLMAEVPAIEWPQYDDYVLPETPVILDVLGFCAASVGDPIKTSYHGYFDHSHLRWDREAGLAKFVDDVNRIFARGGLAYELTTQGQVRRLLPPDLAQALSHTVFATGDKVCDGLLEHARNRILSHKESDRADAVEKLWDAFERLKTLEPGADKKATATALLDRCATPGSRFRAVLEAEAAALNGIGNNFHVRHFESDREPIPSPIHGDYLFARLFAFIRLVLKATGRGG